MTGGQPRSFATDATARAWIVFADSKTFYLFILTGDIALSYHAFMFGDFDSFVSGDVWNCAIQARHVENSGASLGANANSSSDFDTWLAGYVSAGSSGSFVARGVTGAVGSFANGRGAGSGGVTVIGNGAIVYPNTADNSIYLGTPLFTIVNSIRGKPRGLWSWLHSGGINDGDTFSGGGDLAGKTFIGVKNGPNNGIFILETSNTLS